MSAVLLDVKNVSVRFGGLLAVSAASLDIRKGEIHGVIGPNGAGKSTLFNAITGLVTASDGEVILDGTNLTALPAHRRAAHGMRRTFQSLQLLPELTVLENVLIGLHQDIDEGPFCGLFRKPRNAFDETAAVERVRETLAFLGIGHALLKRPPELSFAEQRYVEIARALAARPKLLLLDEPVAGLSPNEVEAFKDMVVRLRDEWGMTVMLVEHVLSVVFGISDRVTVLVHGAVIASGLPDQIARNEAVRAAYLGDQAHA